MRNKTFDSINVVPFIDIMLVLLTIVLATATFIAKGAIPINLPEVEKAEGAKEGIFIEVTKEGRFYFEGVVFDIQMLEKKIAGLGKDEPIILRADRDAVIQIFVDIMNMLKSNGFKNVQLQTRQVGQ